MSSGRKRRFSTGLALIGAVCVPLVALGWSSPASALPPSVTISVVSSANPSSFGQDVTYTATLTTSDSGSLDAGDAVNFQDNANGIVSCNSQMLMATATPGTYTATCDEATGSLSIGDHTITTNFNGDSTYPPASGSLSQTVDQASTTTAITSPSPGSSTTYGSESQIAFDVTVSGPPGASQIPTGNVTLYGASPAAPGPGTYLCSTGVFGGGGGPSNGNCYINDTQLGAGPYVITAVYTGDDNYLGSSSAPQDLTIEQVITQMQSFPVPGYALYGAENGNFFIVGIGGNNNNGNPSGSVSISANGVNLVAPGSCRANNGGANPCYIDSATALPVSTTPYSVTLSYPGDANFLPTSTTAPLTIFPATTSTSLTVTPSSATSGDEGSVVISATVTSGTTGSPTGSVAVQDGGTTVCTIAIHPGGPNTAVGSCPALSGSQLPPGTSALTANYRGDGNYSSSVSSAQSLTINGAAPGYWLVGSDGGIFSFGSAQFYGSTGGLTLQRPVVGIVPTSDHAAYWLDASDGGVFSFGNTRFYGSVPGLGLHPAGSGLANSLNAPIVGMVPSFDDAGYFMVASDGGVFAFGDARFAGSCPGIGGCAGAAVAVMPDSSGNGYWLVTRTGNVYTFGDARYHGAPGNTGSPVTSAVRTPDGGGYWILTANGSVYDYGDAANYGDAAGAFGGLNPATAIFTTTDGGGYWIASANGTVDELGDAPNDGDLVGTHLNGPIIAGTGL
jgi:Big-like domain-containing protein